MQDTRETLKIVVVGHVDHGKSTVVGRLLFDTKSIPEGAIDRVKQISKDKGKPFEYAYLLDAFEEEQKQGITIDTTQLQFHTAKRDYIIIDAPGHKEFLKNMVSGAASAEAALLIIDAQEGIQEQSKRHGYLLSLLGIRKAYVLVNKMDLIYYSQDRFELLRREMNRFLHDLRVYPLQYIPVSAFFGENIVERSDKMPWYKGEPLLSAIDLFEKDTGIEAQALRLPIQDVYKFDQRRIIAGRVESGTLRVGDVIRISPGGRTTKVKSIENWAPKDSCDSVFAGMSVGITVVDEFFNQRGEFISHSSEEPLVAEILRANLFWLGKAPMKRQKEYKLKLATQEVECQLVSITKVIDAATLASIMDADRINTNDVAEVVIRTKKEIAFDEFKNNQNTGRFVIVDGYDVCGGGIITGTLTNAETITRMVKGEHALTVQCFDEYYFVLSENALRQQRARPHTFQPGDVIPVTGETYSYPENFDLIDFHQGLAAKIRRSTLQDLLKLTDYQISAVPIIDVQGFQVKANSSDEFARLRQELNVQKEPGSNEFAAFSLKWFDFGRFRTIHYVDAIDLSDYEYKI